MRRRAFGRTLASVTQQPEAPGPATPHPATNPPAAGHTPAPTGVVPADFWEERYAGSDRVWSGRPNQILTQVAADLPPGRALDLGCGEGGDAIWLAQRGWDVTGLDISLTATRRAAEAARAAGLPPARIRFLAADLSALDHAGAFDLVTASYLHSPVKFPRSEVLRHAAGLVAPGGHLLVVSHADFPPWAQGHDRAEHRFLSAAEEVAEIGLDRGGWTVVLAETRSRDAVGPEGQTAVLDDAVVLARRDG